MRRKFLFVLPFLLLLVSCTSEVCVFENTKECINQKVSDLDLEKKPIILIYLPGSKQENEPDPCYPEENNNGFGVPNVVRQTYLKLKKNHDIKLMAFCAPTKVSNFDGINSKKKPKILLRTEDLIELLKQLKDHGADPEKIFLIGHSAGAWSTLLAKAKNPNLANGVIAIAPAFAGKQMFRPKIWEYLRNSLIDIITQADNFNALVFIFERDEFENKDSMSFLWEMKNVKIEVINGPTLQALNCPFVPMHNIPFDNCFDIYADKMATFIEHSQK
jgi:hypothetical protein